MSKPNATDKETPIFERILDRQGHGEAARYAFENFSHESVLALGWFHNYGNNVSEVYLQLLQESKDNAVLWNRVIFSIVGIGIGYLISRNL